MNLSRIQLIFLLLLPLHSIYAGTDTQPPVTVIYSQTSSDTGAPISVAIPWESGLEMGKAIATAGGFSSPPYREIFLLRGGDTTPVSPKSITEGETPINLQPGDRIEIK